ncbi:MAG: hypothetical protein KBB78_03395, partial [Candidatus Pacebacteria bacterium]|nr:hypothetical protein [Candidatus Paceibacterota bacterium]
MLAGLNPKILGSILIGVAIVAGTYTIGNFGKPRMNAPAAVIESQAPARVAIAVTDKDSNGVEDWRDQLVPEPAAVITQASTSYELPTTLTGQMSIEFLQNYIASKNNGPFGNTKEEVVSEAVEKLTEGSTQELYDTPDITILETWTDEDIKNYANAMAGAVLVNNIDGVDQELNILHDALVRGNVERIGELKTIVEIYKKTLDDSVAIPVPGLFAKYHLDLINPYSALYRDVEAMSFATSDPALTLMRFKR